MGTTKAAKRDRQLTSAVRVIARLSRVAESICQNGELSLPQYRLLLFIATEPQRFGRLASQAALRPPTLTSLIDGLEKRGLVERLAVEGDRRALDIKLTDAGCQAMVATEAALSEAFGHLITESGLRDELLGGLDAVGGVLDHEFERLLESHEKGDA